MESHFRRLVITGDTVLDRFLFVEKPSQTEMNFDTKVISVQTTRYMEQYGGAKLLLDHVNTLDWCYKAEDPFEPEPQNIPDGSFYIIERLSKGGCKKWSITHEIAATQPALPTCQMHRSKGCSDPTKPMLFLDLDMGCLANNRELVGKLLVERPYIVVTTNPLREDWMRIRADKKTLPGIWVWNIADWKEPKFSLDGDWRYVYDQVSTFLNQDRGLWNPKSRGWGHRIIVYFGHDGALIFSACGEQSFSEIPTQQRMAAVENGLVSVGELLFFSGRQPGCYQRLDGGDVHLTAIPFAAALVPVLFDDDALIDCVRRGIIAARCIADRGYDDPQEPNKTLSRTLENVFSEKTSFFGRVKYFVFPQALNGPDARFQYSPSDSPQPVGSWQLASAIVSCKDEELDQKLVLRLAGIQICSEEYAGTLLKLMGRLKNHLAQAPESTKAKNAIFSFAVFGGPGSGKSFVAGQLASAIQEGNAVYRPYRINLSQFESSIQLFEALESIRIGRTSHEVPFIIFDEFDCAYQGEQGGWLRYFLMPLQDGEFFLRNTRKAIAKSVFAFLGGSWTDQDSFRAWALSPEQGRLLKGPDFHSRLDMSFAVPSVDVSCDNEHFDWGRPSIERLNRALMIRILLQERLRELKDSPNSRGEVMGGINLVSIRPDLLAYLLHINLQHGVRSLEKIIKSSQLRNKKVWKLGSLPDKEVLRWHIQGFEDDGKDHAKTLLEKIKYISEIKSDIPLKWLCKISENGSLDGIILEESC